MNNAYKVNNFIYAAFFARRIISLVEVIFLSFYSFIFYSETTLINEARHSIKNIKTLTSL